VAERYVSKNPSQTAHFLVLYTPSEVVESNFAVTQKHAEHGHFVTAWTHCTASHSLRSDRAQVLRKVRSSPNGTTDAREGECSILSARNQRRSSVASLTSRTLPFMIRHLFGFEGSPTARTVLTRAGVSAKKPVCAPMPFI